MLLRRERADAPSDFSLPAFDSADGQRQAAPRRVADANVANQSGARPRDRARGSLSPGARSPRLLADRYLARQ